MSFHDRNGDIAVPCLALGTTINQCQLQEKQNQRSILPSCPQPVFSTVPLAPPPSTTANPWDPSRTEKNKNHTMWSKRRKGDPTKSRTIKLASFHTVKCKTPLSSDLWSPAHVPGGEGVASGEGRPKPFTPIQLWRLHSFCS